MKPLTVLLLVTALAVASLAPSGVLGHHVFVGIYSAPVIDFDNANVSMGITVSPTDKLVGDFSDALVQLTFENDDTNEAFKQVTYSIEVEKQGDLLARNIFYTEDGTATINIKPNDDCAEDLLWKCSGYYGEQHPITGAFYTHDGSNLVIDGPIFTSGGPHHISVEILGVGSVHPNLQDPPKFDLHVSIPQEYTFYIPVSEDKVQ